MVVGQQAQDSFWHKSGSFQIGGIGACYYQFVDTLGVLLEDKLRQLYKYCVVVQSHF